MTLSLRRDSNSIKVANFYENFKLKKYDFEPNYQRKSIWSEEKKSFLIDSIIKNFPIPPIFLRLIIDDNTGSTQYEVIDGKQRLTSIIEFIENKIQISDDFDQDEPFFDDQLAGKYFKDLDEPQLSEYKASFWRYVIPVEYIDTDNTKVIDCIFDRLNRNGEPLTGQELRHAKYNNSLFLRANQNFAKNLFWEERLEVTDKKRMEDIEFLSELSFVILERGPQESKPEIIDNLYQKYTDSVFDDMSLTQSFEDRTNFLIELNLDYRNLKISGVSHLYGLWCFADHCINNHILPDSIKKQLSNFFKSPEESTIWEAYKSSMSSRTRSKSQRVKRMNSLKEACGLQ